MHVKNSKIDIVIPWVDGNDPNWQLLMKEYRGIDESNSGNCDARFREFELMRYWFRGVEKNMPWVNRIFFVTFGHLPKWLNTDNEKLRVINHRDYIPEKYLPTFNSNVIELNYHRIDELSENFLAFNDDLFVIDNVGEDYFFRNNLPCDMMLLKTLVNYDRSSFVWHMAFNNMGIINKYHAGGKTALKHFTKWINPCYGARNNLGNLLKIPGKRISGYYDGHVLIPHKKSVFKKVWELEGDYLDSVCMNRFRTPLDLNQWLMRYWNFAAGEFEPIDNTKFSQYFEFGEQDSIVDTMCDAIRQRKKAVIVINDTIPDSKAYMFDEYKRKLQSAFEEILPEKSGFEK